MEKPVKENEKETHKGKAEQPPELVLPFGMEKQQDIGEAIYDRRVPIFISAIVYLALALIFVSSKIILQKEQTVAAIMVDLQEMEELVKELEEAKELNEMLSQMQPDDGEPVRNVVSSEEGEESEPEQFRPAPTMSATEDFMKHADEVEQRMRETREAYEQALMSQDELREEQREKAEFEDPRAKPIKVEGKVTVYYSLKKPSRTAVDLFVPAYQCRKGGRVVVDIVVATGGEVVSAVVAKAFSTDDWCMHETAIKAAYRSRFNVYPGAPPRQEGRIIYTFVPQERS